MNIYKTVPQFDKNTGKSIEPLRVHVTVACDFCGHVTEEGYSEPTPTLQIHEHGNIESQYHEDHLKVKIDGEEVEIDLNELMYSHPDFTYCQEWGEDHADTCELNMVQRWLSGDFTGNLLCHVMYQCRYEVIQKLIDKGYDLTTLKLEED